MEAMMQRPAHFEGTATQYQPAPEAVGAPPIQKDVQRLLGDTLGQWLGGLPVSSKYKGMRRSMSTGSLGKDRKEEGTPKRSRQDTDIKTLSQPMAVHISADARPCQQCHVEGPAECPFDMCRECCSRVADNPCRAHGTNAWRVFKAHQYDLLHQRRRKTRGFCRMYQAGLCRQGSKCWYDHGDGDDIVFEWSPTGPIKRMLKVQAHDTDKETEAGDKLLLPPSVLMEAIAKDLPSPYTFSLTSTKDSTRTVHGGVLEFTAGDKTVHMSRSMMASLALCAGDSVCLATVSLQKGTFVKLQPLQAGWVTVPLNVRRTLLEFELRKYQTLTEGCVATVTYGRNTYSLRVAECRPAPAISIIDTDLAYDLADPEEQGIGPVLVAGHRIKGTVAYGQYSHYAVRLQAPIAHGQQLHIRSVGLDCSGDPDLYISQSEMAPHRAWYTWFAEHIGGSSVIIDPKDSNYNPQISFVYVGVRGFSESKGPVSFELCVDIERAKEVSVETTLRETGGTSETIGPGQAACQNCGKAFPSARVFMHEIHCRRNTFKCATCNKCMSVGHRAKHQAQAHDQLSCECGETMEQGPLHTHQITQCKKRLVPCLHKWCNLQVEAGNLEAHDRSCATARTPCILCSVDVRRQELEMHLSSFHGVETELIDWSQPLESQRHVVKERALECPCGAQFVHLDELQMHQLTECPELAHTFQSESSPAIKWTLTDQDGNTRDISLDDL